MSAGPDHMNEVLIVGAGIGGLTAALELHRRGISCRVFESAPEIKAVGVGINLLPHATEVLGGLGLIPELEEVAVETSEAAFFNRFGQLIYKEALGRRAGYASPQFSIHRADLQAILLEAVKARIGAERLHLGWHCLGFTQQASFVELAFRDRAPPRCGAGSPWAATASIRSSAGSSIPTRASRATAASTCGAG
jgi:5-methylphenazine-1-carboxylate 1-monooxygenase